MMGINFALLVAWLC